ncbi:hypothetical protein [Sorangium cellulosum]|uniref:Uncharacterized protein n=1 Tax=Sorangium cellulosum TaxID=56 RepID=A0A150QFT4_SORCE|nr:hypothetical protein [Sorangium cellulosum]KYF66855.1 hypothetical protein BE15_39140 [Sorangium cellulosum]
MITLEDLDERAREALAAAWASRRPGRARQALLAAPVGEVIAADIARLPGAQAAGDAVIAVVSAEYAARVLDLGFGWQGGEVREADSARVLVVSLGDEEAAVAYLDEVRGGAACSSEATTRKHEAFTGQAAQDEGSSRAGSREDETRSGARRSEMNIRTSKRKRGNGQYGCTTKVSAAESRDQIEKVLARYGADAFSYQTNPKTSTTTLTFQAHERLIRFELVLPRPGDFEVDAGGKRRGAKEQASACEQAIKQRWRAMLLIIKAKLEAIESGVVDFESEFMPQMVLPDRGITVAQVVREAGFLPQLTAAPAPEVAGELLPPARRRGVVEAHPQ